MLQLTDANQQTEWFFLDEKCVPYAKDIKVGDTISVDYNTFQEDGKNKKRISFLKKEADGGGSPSAAEPGAGAPRREQKSYGQKSKRESEKITRLSVLASTATMVSALIEKEQISIDDLGEIFNTDDGLFSTLLKRVNENLPEEE